MFIDPDGREHTPVIKYLQTAINNCAKEIARRRYEDAINGAFSFKERRIKRTPLSSLNNKNYVAKFGTTSDDAFIGKSTFSFYNKTFKNVIYVLFKGDDLDKYNITNIIFQGDEKGSYAFRDGDLGYFVVFEGYGNLNLAYLNVGSLGNLNKIREEMLSNVEVEFQNLLNKDPLIKEYVDLMDYYRNVLLPAHQSKDKSKENNKDYKEKEKIYEAKSKAFAEKRNKKIKEYE